MLSIFCSYSHNDEHWREQLAKHLKPLERQGLISTWHDRELRAGDAIDEKIDEALDQADLVLLLVSSDFLASEYCYSRELNRALDRHATGKVRLIPIILRPCDWQSTPLGSLLATPKDGLPVTKWADRDEAFLDIAKAIRAEAVQAKRRKPDACAEPSGTGEAGKYDGHAAEQPRPAAGRSAAPAARSSHPPLREIIVQFDKVMGLDSGLGGTIKFDFGKDGSVLIDGKSVPNKVVDGEGLAADCDIVLSLDTFDKMVTGELDGTSAFMQGKLRIKGKMDLAMKLGPLLQRARA